MEVLYPLAPISHFSPRSPFIHAAAPLSWKDEEPVQMDGVHSSESMSHFQNHSCQLKNDIVFCKIIEQNV